MSRSFPAFLVLFACATEPVSGTVVDGLSSQPVGGFRLVASAVGEGVAPTCMAHDAEVAEDGTFAFTDLCADVAYRLRPDREGLWLADTDQVAAGLRAAPLEVVAWPAPKGTGLYAIRGGDLVAVKTTDEVRSEELGEGDAATTFRYGAHTGRSAHPVAAGDRLLIVGAESLKHLEIWPLSEEGPRELTTADGRTVQLETHEALGAEAVTPGEAGVVNKEGGERAVRYLASDALPAGRYAIVGEGDRRMYLVEFGATP